MCIEYLEGAVGLFGQEVEGYSSTANLHALTSKDN